MCTMLMLELDDIRRGEVSLARLAMAVLVGVGGRDGFLSLAGAVGDAILGCRRRRRDGDSSRRHCVEQRVAGEQKGRRRGMR